MSERTPTMLPHWKLSRKVHIAFIAFHPSVHQTLTEMAYFPYASIESASSGSRCVRLVPGCALRIRGRRIPTRRTHDREVPSHCDKRVDGRQLDRDVTDERLGTDPTRRVRPRRRRSSTSSCCFRKTFPSTITSERIRTRRIPEGEPEFHAGPGHSPRQQSSERRPARPKPQLDPAVSSGSHLPTHQRPKP